MSGKHKRRYSPATARGHAAARYTPEERFWSRVNKTDTCWLWTGTGSRTGLGYGRFQPELGNPRLVGSHRWAYEQLVGPIPPGLHLDHLCRTPSCVNPAHLEPVTNRENQLRGVGFPARNAAKTHCPQGHPYAGPNLYIAANGGRICRTCLRERARVRYRAKREAS